MATGAAGALVTEGTGGLTPGQQVVPADLPKVLPAHFTTTTTTTTTTSSSALNSGEGGDMGGSSGAGPGGRLDG